MKWTYVTIATESDKYITDDTLRVFSTQRSAFCSAYAMAKEEVKLLNTVCPDEEELYGVPCDTDFENMREVKTVIFAKGRKSYTTLTRRVLRQVEV